TFMTFTLARRFGMLADRYGPRWFMGFGPIIAAIGLALLMTLDSKADYISQLLPALLVFGLGLSMTVAPLTAAVLAAVDEKHSGVASGVNNAIARVAGLLAIAVLGAFVSSQFSSVVDGRLDGRPLSARAQAAVKEAKDRSLTTQPAARVPPRERAEVLSALDDGSTSAFHLGLGIGAGLVLAGGLVSLVGIENPRRSVPCADCPGGALVGASEDVGKLPRLELPRGEPAPA
ncbi:MAG: MFS transporter, partial [Solirubrobacteraceae bacterium]